MTAATHADDGALRQFVAVLAKPPAYSGSALAYLRQELMTTEEAATTLKCSEAAVMQRVEDGELIGVSVGATTVLVTRRRVDRIADLAEARRPAHERRRRRWGKIVRLADGRGDVVLRERYEVRGGMTM